MPSKRDHSNENEVCKNNNSCVLIVYMCFNNLYIYLCETIQSQIYDAAFKIINNEVVFTIDYDLILSKF